MRRLLFICMVLFIGTLPMTINTIVAQGPSVAGSTASPAQDNSSVRSWPPDTNTYVRKVISEDYGVSKRPALPSAVFVRDVVISNTDPTLTTTDTFNDGEPTIAVNPANPNEIVISAFSGGWGANAPIWHSIDGGTTWTERFTVPVPTGLGPGCPCDQAFDYGRGGRLSGTFLKTDVYSGTTTDPTNSAAWGWLTSMGVAVRTNSAGIGNADQPWLLVNRDPTTASQDNLYVAYDDFLGSPDMRVAVALGTNPPNFVRDGFSGFSTGFVNPGHRLAVNPNNGFVYSLFQRRVALGAGGSQNINFMLNRSTDGGQTWGLNASSTGIAVANADSTQPQPKFGTVNALLGGVLHAAVDPTNGDVYYVHGNRDSGTGNNRLSIIRLTDNGAGGLTIGTPHFVTGQLQAALPSVAVTSNGTVGVLYDTFNGIVTGFPQFTAHFATSTDQGVTFTDNPLLTFLSSATDNADTRQRVLGDYQQVKAVGTTFYGAFTANGAPLGRPFANHDPIFFKLDVGCTSITCPANITTNAAAGQCSAVVTYPAPTTTGGACTVTCAPASGATFPKGTTTVTCSNTGGAPNCTFTITVNDNQPPSITCPANIIRSTDPNLCTAVVTYLAPIVSDNCPGVGTPVCAPASGSIFPKGVTTVQCTVGDASGNTAACTFTITVNDTQPPSITCPANIIQSTDPNLCSAVVTYSAPIVSDNCPGVGMPVCVPASGSTFPKGTTTVICNVADATGNATICFFTITVNDNQPPVITCPPSQTAVTDQNACPAPACVTVNYPAPVAFDNCPGVVVVCNPPAGSCFPTGVTTVTCTATDTSGNTATCSFTVTTFDSALQDDSNPSTILLWNSITGAYRFCCNGITLTGVGKSTIQGCVYTLQHNPFDRRVLGRVDKAVHSGNASIQAPPGTTRCTITDRNTLNDANLTSCQ